MIFSLGIDNVMVDKMGNFYGAYEKRLFKIQGLFNDGEDIEPIYQKLRVNSFWTDPAGQKFLVGLNDSIIAVGWFLVNSHKI